MAVKEMYVVLTREHGLFLVEPVPGRDGKVAIEAALGMRGGYSSGLVQLDLPEGVDEAWIAWAEGQTPAGKPDFYYRAVDPALSEDEVVQFLNGQGEEPIKLNKSEIYWAKNFVEPVREPEPEELPPN